MSIITVENHGPLILATDYWGSEYELAGKLYVSCNAGAIRVLMPRTCRAWIEDMRAAREVVLSRGPWPAQDLADAVELLFDDGTDEPFAIHLSLESFDFLPAEPNVGREWILTVWDLKKTTPHQSLQRVCHWRRVAKLPCLKPWGAADA